MVGSGPNEGQRCQATGRDIRNGKLLSILVIRSLVEAARRQYVFVPNLEEMRYWLFYPSFQGPFPCGDAIQVSLPCGAENLFLTFGT